MIPDLQPRFVSSQRLSYTIQTGSNALMMDSLSENTTSELTVKNFSHLQRFKIRTAMSLGPPQLKSIYEDEVFDMTLKVSIISC